MYVNIDVSIYLKDEIHFRVRFERKLFNKPFKASLKVRSESSFPCLSFLKGGTSAMIKHSQFLYLPFIMTPLTDK
jgi:hypothetical protein